MRTARGLFEALGAGVPLVALLACAVLGVTVAVGMRGWPGTGATPAWQQLGSAPAGALAPNAVPDSVAGFLGAASAPRVVSAAMPTATSHARRRDPHRAPSGSPVHR